MSVYGYLPEGWWSAASNNDHSPQWCDGRYVWVFNNGKPLERFDTETLFLERINSRRTSTGNTSLDSHDPTLATIAYSSMSHVTGDDNFMYWLEPFKVDDSSSDSHLGVLRRMSLNEPHYVQTVDNGWDSPANYVKTVDPNEAFYGMDQDKDWVYVDSSSPLVTNGLAVLNNYLYLTTLAFDAAGNHTYRICRWPLAGGDIEVLYEVPAASTITGDSNVLAVRGPGWSLPYHGMGGPDLEGLDFSISKLNVVGDKLILFNLSTVTTTTGRYPNANNVAFDIPALVEVAPLVHDRANPWYTMINNGSGNYESGSDYSYGVQDRFYAIRDGAQPLVDTHMISSGTAGRGEHEGSFLFLEGAYFEGLQDRTSNMFVHKLDPAGAEAQAVWEITLSFEGKALQGYGRQVILHGKEGPKEVTLE